MAPTSYATPGVYVEEISTLPPSIAETGTAIPAFIGTTSKHVGGSVKVAEINSLRDFEDHFGSAPPTQWKVSFSKDQDTFTINDQNNNPVDRFSEPECLLWYAIDLYFRNGGSRCYVFSVGTAEPSSSGNEKPPAGPKPPELPQALINGLDALKSYDEPTLIVIPEVIKLNQEDYGTVCKAALQHAGDQKNRFVLLDAVSSAGSTLTSSDLIGMRAPLGSDNLDRGALYYPFLLTTLVHLYEEDKIEVADLTGINTPPPSNPESGQPAETGEKNQGNAPITLQSLATTHTSHYNQIKKQLSDQRVILPPSAAIAGVIASVDRERGVWKAPANVGLQAVVAPVGAGH